MTKIKFCGLKRPCDIAAANRLRPTYAGFVFAKKSSRYLTYETAEILRRQLSKEIQTVGVFVNAAPEEIAAAFDRGIIDLAQLHGNEDEAYIRRLRAWKNRPLIKAFQIDTMEDIRAAEQCIADFVLLDHGGGGTGARFDWNLLEKMQRPYFLAGGLDAASAAEAVRRYHPYAVDVSSGIETEGFKDPGKMEAFLKAVQAADGGSRFCKLNA